MPVSTLHNAFNYFAGNILFYASALLAQTCSFITSGTGKLKAALLMIKSYFFTGITSIFYTPPSFATIFLQMNRAEEDEMLEKLASSGGLIPDPSGGLQFQLSFSMIYHRIKINVDRQNEHGMTALMIASSAGDQELVQLLLNNSADVNLRDKNGWTALMLACMSGHRSVAKLLLKCGANINLQDKNGMTALMLASIEGHVPVVQLLLDRGANINRQNKDKNRWTPLMLACVEKNKTLVELFLRHGAEITSQTLAAAEQSGNSDIMQLLRDFQQ